MWEPTCGSCSSPRVGKASGANAAPEGRYTQACVTVRVPKETMDRNGALWRTAMLIIYKRRQPSGQSGETSASATGDDGRSSSGVPTVRVQERRASRPLSACRAASLNDPPPFPAEEEDVGAASGASSPSAAGSAGVVDDMLASSSAGVSANVVASCSNALRGAAVPTGATVIVATSRTVTSVGAAVDASTG